MKTISLIALIFLIQSTVFAQSPKSSRNYSPKTTQSTKLPLTLEFLIASEQTRDIVDKKVDGIYTKFDSSLLQDIDSKNQIRYFLSTRYIDTKADPSQNIGNKFEMFFFELMYRKKNILNQADHGFNLTAEIKNYWIMDDHLKRRYGYDGTFIPQVILKRRFGRSSSVKMKVRRHFYDTNNQDNYTLNFEDRIYLSLTNVFNRKFMLNNQIKYQHKQRKGNGKDFRFMELAEFGPFGPDHSNLPEANKHQELVTLHTGLSYFLNRSNMLEFYAETKLSNTYDKRDLETITSDEFVFGTALYLTAF